MSEFPIGFTRAATHGAPCSQRQAADWRTQGDGCFASLCFPWELSALKHGSVWRQITCSCLRWLKRKPCEPFGVSELQIWSGSSLLRVHLRSAAEASPPPPPPPPPQVGSGRCPWCWTLHLPAESDTACWRAATSPSAHCRSGDQPAAGTGWRLPGSSGSPAGNQEAQKHRRKLRQISRWKEELNNFWKHVLLL